MIFFLDLPGCHAKLANMPQKDTPIHGALLIPKEYKLGPAMSKLTERQRAFVVALLDFGGINPNKAARMAGYSVADGGAGLAVTAHRLAHDEKIQDAIQEEAGRRLRTGSIMAVKTLLEIADNPAAEHRDRLKAVEMILNRTGLHAISEKNVTVTHVDQTSDEMIKRIALLARNQGLDPVKLLGNAGVVVDADFKEVVETPEPVERDPNDLSDLL